MVVMTEEEILNSIIPEAEVEDITFETNSNRSLKVRVRYSVSDVVGSDAIGTWFNQQEYEKYFIIKTVMSIKHYGEELPISIINTEQMLNIDLENTEFIASDGSRVNKFSFERIYNIDREPENLTFTVRSNFDIEALENSYDIDLRDLFTVRGGSSQLDKVNTTIILDQGQLKYPIQDFRIMRRSSRLELNEQSIIESLSRTYSEQRREIRRKSSLSKDFVSNLMVTRNGQGEAKFLFILDVESFYKKASKYGMYYSNLNRFDKEKLLETAEVNYFAVLRKRVKRVKGKTGIASVIDFPGIESEVVVASTRKASGSSFLENRNEDYGAIKQVQVEIDNMLVNSLHFLTGTDYNISEKTDGLYSYGVEISMVDNFKDFLRKKVKDVEDTLAEVDVLYQKTIQPEYYNILTNRLKLPLQDIDPLAISTLGDHISNVNKLASIFAPEFTIGALALGATVTPEYIEIIIDATKLLIQNVLSDLGESRTGHSDRISSTAVDPRIELKKFYDFPEMLFDTSIPKLTGLDYFSEPATSYSTEEVTDFSLKELQTLAKDSGEIGLKVIDGAQFKTRYNTEILKHFSSENPAINPPIIMEEQQSGFSINLGASGSEFLSPSAFPLGKKDNVVKFSSKDISSNMKIINNLVLGNTEEVEFISKYGVYFGDEGDSPLTEQEKGKKRSRYRKRTIDGSTNRRKQNKRREEEEKREKDFQSFVFSKMRKLFTSPNLGTDAELRTEPPKKEVSENISTSLTATSIWTQQNSAVRAGLYQSAPNQVKSYSLLGTSSESFSEWEQSNYDNDTWQISLGFLAKMQYLSGFKMTDDGDNILICPVFLPLTKEVYLENEQKSLLCRLQKTALDEFGIRKARNNKPLYDEIFIVQPPAGAQNAAILEEQVAAFEEEQEINQRERTQLLVRLANERELELKRGERTTLRREVVSLNSERNSNRRLKELAEQRLESLQADVSDNALAKLENFVLGNLPNSQLYDMREDQLEEQIAEQLAVIGSFEREINRLSEEIDIRRETLISVEAEIRRLEESLAA